MVEFSRRRKRIYFFISIVIFVLLAPILILYSLGFNISKNFSIFKTGGIYVYSNDVGSKFYINGKLEDNVSLFKHDFLTKNLVEKNYRISLEKEGFYTWNKDVEVKEEKITEGYPFLVPKNPKIEEVENNLDLMELFATTSKKTIDKKTDISFATTTEMASTSDIVLNSKIGIYKKNNDVIATWKGQEDRTPFQFCPNEASPCKDILVYSGKKIGTINFYPSRSDLFLIVDDKNIYVVELDTRNPQNIFTLYKGEGKGDVDFRILDNETIVIKEGKKIKTVSLSI